METSLLWLSRLLTINPWALALFAIGAGLVLWARRRTDAALRSGAEEASRLWTTGAEAAEEIPHAAELEGVTVASVRGPFADYYERETRTIRLSPAVFEGHSLAMLAIAAIEAGHALQHARRDSPLPLWLRDASAQFVRLAPRWLIATAIVGFLLNIPGLLHGSLAAFPLAVALPLMALPIEWDAARRARRALAMTALVDSRQVATLDRILDALAWRLIDPALPRFRQPAWLHLDHEGGPGPDPTTEPGPRPSPPVVGDQRLFR